MDEEKKEALAAKFHVSVPMICVTWEETTGALRQILVSEKKREIVIASLEHNVTGYKNKAVKKAHGTHIHVTMHMCLCVF